MKKKLVEVNCYGVLGETVKHKTWNLAVQSVSEAIHAIEILSKRKLYKFLHENDKKGVKYAIIVNGKELALSKQLKDNDIQEIQNSELCIKNENLKSIDIVPIFQGADVSPENVIFDVFLGGAVPGGGQFVPTEYKNIIGGVILIIAGIIVSIYAGPVGGAIIMAGIGLIAAGVINLLSKPPQIEEFKSRQKTSYLFNGPSNTISEGAPIPVGYGTLIVGSAPISASYDIEYFDTGFDADDNVNKKAKKKKNN